MINDEIKSYDLTISDVWDGSFVGKCIGEHERIKLFHWVEISFLMHASHKSSLKCHMALL